MATSSNRATGTGIMGAVFAITGLIFMMSGKAAIGIAIAGTGVVFIAVAAAAARKAASQSVSSAAQAPAGGDIDGAEPVAAPARRSS